MAASATFALKPGVWFRRGRLLMVSPDKMGTACPLSDRNSTYRPVQISGTGSTFAVELAAGLDLPHVHATAARAEGLAIGLRPAELAERLIGLLFAHAVDRPERQVRAAALRRKWLDIIIISSAYALEIVMTCHLVKGKSTLYDDRNHRRA